MGLFSKTCSVCAAEQELTAAVDRLSCRADEHCASEWYLGVELAFPPVQAKQGAG